MEIILICGYARAGKTTAMNILERQGFPCYSTSAKLYELYSRLQKIHQNLPPLTNDDKQVTRKLLISLAEDVIVPVLGREAIVMGTLKWLIKQHIAGVDTVIVETIGGNELDILQSLLASWSSYPLFIHMAINIRRKTEQPGVDKRELIKRGYTKYPVYNVWNDGTVDELGRLVNEKINFGNANYQW